MFNSTIRIIFKSHPFTYTSNQFTKQILNFLFPFQQLPLSTYRFPPTKRYTILCSLAPPSKFLILPTIICLIRPQ